MTDSLPQDRGLDEHGHVRREGDLSRVQPEFAGLVTEYAAAARAAFGSELDSGYLYGSVPRGTARPGVSDLDGQLLLSREPTEADRVTVRELEESLGAAYPQVRVVEILLDRRAALTDPAEHRDGGFHVRVLCTPVWGPDAGLDVAPHVVDLALARGIQGDWRGALERLRAQTGTSARGGHGGAPASGDDTATAALCRSTGRRLARIAFAWVMPRWGGWSSDPSVMHQVVEVLQPRWSGPMGAAVRLGWAGELDLDLAVDLLTGWTEELIAHGTTLGQPDEGQAPTRWE